MAEREVMTVENRRSRESGGSLGEWWSSRSGVSASCIEQKQRWRSSCNCAKGTQRMHAMGMDAAAVAMQQLSGRLSSIPIRGSPTYSHTTSREETRGGTIDAVLVAIHQSGVASTATGLRGRCCGCSMSCSFRACHDGECLSPVFLHSHSHT